jgi:transcriptional regulator with XRE-family HTH domain
MRVTLNDFNSFLSSQMLTRSEVGQKTGLSASTMNRLDRGLPVRSSTVEKLLAGLGLTLDDARREGLISKIDLGA